MHIFYLTLLLCDEAGVSLRWTGSLAVFLRYLRKHFLERLYFEHLPLGASPDDDEEDSAAEEDAEGNAVGDADMAEPDEEPADVTPVPEGEAVLSKQADARFASRAGEKPAPCGGLVCTGKTVCLAPVL